jgi:uncharacterized membrane protein
MQEPSLPLQSPAYRQVSSGRGVEWWSSAWQLLFNRGAAGVWIVVCLIAIVIYAALHLVPLFGTIAAQIAAFLFSGGLMAAARKTDEGTAVAVGDLFGGFGPKLGALTIGAVLLLVATLLVFGALTIVGGGALLGALFGSVTGNLALLAGAGATWLLLLLAALLLMVPVGMAAWLAPALIVLREQPPVEALKASLAACWANLGPLTVYGLLWIAFAIVASIPFGLGWLVLVPLTVLSTYTAYKDLFEAAGQAE